MDGDRKDWEAAGRIAATGLKLGVEMIKVGTPLLAVTEAIEQKIFSMGGTLAFPTQINFNEVAAHDCASPDEDRLFKDGDLLKIDVGACVNGAIGDNAASVSLNSNDELVKATRDAVNNGVKVALPGNTNADIGRTIQETIESYGFKPIRNLSGHGLGIWEFHAAPSIPNIDIGKGVELKEGQTIAVEPFACEEKGVGLVKEQQSAQVFMLVNNNSVRSSMARDVMKTILKVTDHKPLPFALRHLAKHLPLSKIGFGLRELQKVNNVVAYPPLMEANGALVSQAEHSVIVDDKPQILTKV